MNEEEKLFQINLAQYRVKMQLTSSLFTLCFALQYTVYSIGITLYLNSPDPQIKLLDLMRKITMYFVPISLSMFAVWVYNFFNARKYLLNSRVDDK